MNERTYPLNAWYAAAWSSEIEHELNARTVCERDLVIYRKSSGEVVALEDACWHRLLPLSLGKLDGDQVMCGYHGLKYDENGRCVFMPSQETINPSACVRAYPTEERHGLVWVWTGNPALADADKVPDFHWNTDPELAGRGGTFYSMGCNYRLLVDNLMDLTHETYVHAGSIGHDAITRTPFEVDHNDTHVVMTRWMFDESAPPAWSWQLGRDVPVDRWHIISFEAPSTVVGDVGVADAGTGASDGDRSQGVTGYFMAAITPETATTCHYFWNFRRDHHVDDPQWTEDLHRAHVNGNGVDGLYEQDVNVLEAQQRAIDKQPRQPFYSLNIDAGALWARRLIERMIEAEQSGIVGEKTADASSQSSEVSR